MDNKLYYFSYGMNCNPEIMAMHDNCKALGVATLTGYHLVFKFHANIEPGEKMMGVLWEINEETLKRLDYQESYPTHYDRAIVEVQCCDGLKYKAHVYILANTAPKFTFDTLPTDEYIKHIIFGYSKFGIPKTQLNNALDKIKIGVL